MAEEDLMKKELDIFEDGIKFDEKKYSVIKDYLNNNDKMQGNAGDGCIIYLTNHLNPNQIPYGIILRKEGGRDNSTGILFIHKNHPMKEQIKKDLGKLIGEHLN